MTMMTNLESLEEFANELRNSLPVPVIEKKKTKEYSVDQLYNIYKRSMPIGVNKIVIVGLLRTEADDEVLRLIRREAKRRQEDNDGVWYYFDIVPMPGTEEEKSLYYNDERIVL